MSDVLERAEVSELHVGEPVRWTPRRVEEFLALFSIGLSFSKIAKAMGISRNAALAKGMSLQLWRNGKQVTPRMIEEPEKDQRMRDRHVEKPPVTLPGKSSTEIFRRHYRGKLDEKRCLKEALAEPNTIADKVLALSSVKCPWPSGNPEDKGFHFCCQEKPVDRPYCPTHYALAYKPWVRK